MGAASNSLELAPAIDEEETLDAVAASGEQRVMRTTPSTTSLANQAVPNPCDVALDRIEKKPDVCTNGESCIVRVLLNRRSIILIR